MGLFVTQPAPKIYAFDRGWRVLRFVWANIYQKTGPAANWWYSKGKDQFARASYANAIIKYWRWCIGLGFYIGGASQYISATFVASTFAVLQTIILGIWAGIALVLIGIIMGWTFLYSKIYQLFYRCPVCYEEMVIPTFRCSKCSEPHTRLRPSLYGVFHHTCISSRNGVQCNTKLATLDFLGRKKLERFCPNPDCNHPLNTTIGKLPPVHVAVAGGPSTGKTNYIVMATREFKDRYAVDHGYQVTFPDQKDEGNFTRDLALLGTGRSLIKTPDEPPSAYNLEIRAPHSAIAKALSPGARLGKLAYVYDVAGEFFADSARTSLQGFYRYVDGLIFVVDPFSIPEFRAKHRDEIEQLRTLLRPSDLDIEDAYDRMQQMLEVSINLKPGKPTNRPLAVVVTKVDALGLEDQIGATAARVLMAQDSSICLEEDAMNILVRRFLAEKNGLDNLVRKVEAQFANARYFSCSALGRLPDPSTSGAFNPIRTAEPLVWVLGRSRTVSAIHERAALMDARHRALMKPQGGGLKGYRYYYWGSLKPRSSEGNAA